MRHWLGVKGCPGTGAEGVPAGVGSALLGAVLRLTLGGAWSALRESGPVPADLVPAGAAAALFARGPRIARPVLGGDAVAHVAATPVGPRCGGGGPGAPKPIYFSWRTETQL